MDRAGRLRAGSALIRRGALVLAAAVATARATAAATGATWILEGGQLQPSPGGDVAAPVGSLQKPFVAAAWARAHGDAPTPRFTCAGGHSCWLESGHGVLGLSRATALSCNAYFQQLAADVPAGVLASTFLEEGFRVAGPLSPASAIGLDAPPGVVTVTPRALLEAYVRLTRVPWLTGEPVRREVLSGMRGSAFDGTAKALAHHGYWAKTGTVERRSGAGAVGWALAVDDSGWAILTRVEPGVGRQAAAALGESLARERPWSAERGASRTGPEGHALAASPPARGRVRVRLFERLRPRAVSARNLGPAPVASEDGFVGPGATVALRPGGRLGQAPWELRIPEKRLVRVFEAALSVDRGQDGSLGIVAEMDRREYVSGVIAAELAGPGPERRAELGAAVLRFLARGPRHAGADVCDSTHCAFFIGRGPRTTWTSPEEAVPAGAALRPADDVLWSRILTAAAGPGPDQWTSHCGGQPLSAHAVWGNGDRGVRSCSLHGPASARHWTRTWRSAEVERAFGGGVRSLRVKAEDGVWGLEIAWDGREPRRLLYDDAHRRLARVMGWGSLPSPADRVFRSAAGWQAEGVGLGHRVGLCLGPAVSNADAAMYRAKEQGGDNCEPCEPRGLSRSR